jgi:2-succinyl-5-enolpyruvyl-6-hydroxy-3-cyclohexene-1-carboxylate synthase
LRARVADGVAAPGTSIIEVRTDRAANLALHRALAAAVAAALPSR